MEEKRKTKIKIANKLKYIKFLVFLGFLLLGFGRVDAVSAATMYLSPSSGSHSVGDSFSVSVYVSSPDQAMNAASGVISFPSDKLEVTSLSKSGSIMSLWVQEPSFTASSVNFEGIVLNPGFKGSSGKLITINFKAKAGGSVYLSFSSGSVLANDGQGTNILSALGDATFTFDVPTIVKPPAQEGPVVGVSNVRGVPPAPEPTSPTHPDSDKWYNINNVIFEWDLTSDITGVNILADRLPGNNPGTRSDGLINDYEFEDVDDGEWYFHIRFRNAAGWGDIAHVKFNIDTVKPSKFTAEIVDPENTVKDKIQIKLNAQDELSGIDHYKIEIDKIIQPNVEAENGEYLYETPALAPGIHIINIKAYDKADNYLEQSLEINIEKVPKPIIKDAPISIVSSEILILSGEGVPNSTVNLWIEKDGTEVHQHKVPVNGKGFFNFVEDRKLDPGIYKVWANLTTEQGLQSEMTQPITIVINQSLLLRIGSFIISLLSILIPILGLILVIILLIWYFMHKTRNIRCDYKKEFSHALNSMERIYDILKADMSKELARLERIKKKRALNAEEKRLKRHINSNLKSLEDILGEELTRSGRKKK